MTTSLPQVTLTSKFLNKSTKFITWISSTMPFCKRFWVVQSMWGLIVPILQGNLLLRGWEKGVKQLISDLRRVASGDGYGRLTDKRKKTHQTHKGKESSRVVPVCLSFLLVFLSVLLVCCCLSLRLPLLHQHVVHQPRLAWEGREFLFVVPAWFLWDCMYLLCSVLVYWQYEEWGVCFWAWGAWEKW